MPCGREDGEWQRFMAKHPFRQFDEMTLETMLPYVNETEKWLEAHPVADKEYIRGVVMKAYERHIDGEEPMGEVSEMCEKALKG